MNKYDLIIVNRVNELENVFACISKIYQETCFRKKTISPPQKKK